VVASVGAFAFRASFDHGLLRDREGGRPMFDEAQARALGAGPGIVFVDTDHGFAIGHDPSARAPRDLEVLRLRGDAIDHLAWEARGRPAAWRWALSTLADGDTSEAQLVPYQPAASDRIEGESLWPAVGQQGASAFPRWASGSCASAGRWLGVALDAERGAVDLELPAALAGRVFVARVARAAGVELTLVLLRGGETIATSKLPPSTGAPWACEQAPALEATAAPAASGALRLRLQVVLPVGARHGQREVVAALDAVQLSAPASAPARAPASAPAWAQPWPREEH
jgi:hypothetical protein